MWIEERSFSKLYQEKGQRIFGINLRAMSLSFWIIMQMAALNVFSPSGFATAANIVALAGWNSVLFSSYDSPTIDWFMTLIPA